MKAVFQSIDYIHLYLFLKSLKLSKLSIHCAAIRYFSVSENDKCEY